MIFDKVEELLSALPGKIGLYYKNLETGHEYGFNEDEAFVAASIIKIPVMIGIFHKVNAGLISFDDTIAVRREEMVPSCGVVQFLHEGCTLTVRDLCYLMIVISDNTATNLLIKYFIGTEYVNEILAGYGINKTRLNRMLFDYESRNRGIENYFSPKEIGLLLEMTENGELISKQASEGMLDILKNQQLNHKIPHYLPEDTVIAHKTGEDDGTTHDAGIVYSKSPFILCCASNNTDVVQTEAAFRKISKLCFEQVWDGS